MISPAAFCTYKESASLITWVIVQQYPFDESAKPVPLKLPGLIGPLLPYIFIILLVRVFSVSVECFKLPISWLNAQIRLVIVQFTRKEQGTQNSENGYRCRYRYFRMWFLHMRTTQVGWMVTSSFRACTSISSMNSIQAFFQLQALAVCFSRPINCMCSVTRLSTVTSFFAEQFKLATLSRHAAVKVPSINSVSCYHSSLKLLISAERTAFSAFAGI